MPRPRACLCVVCAVLGGALALVLLAASGAAQAADAPAGKPVSFIADVAPILKESCFACHDSKKRSGKLDMTTFAKLLAGGVHEETVTPGDPDASELCSLCASDQNRRMPPRDKGEALPRDKVAVLRRWVAEGAKLDAGIDPQADLLKELRVRWQPPAPPESYRFPVVVNALAFAPDGERLVVGGHHELTVWEAATGKLLARLRTRAERAHALAFLPDGLLVVAGGRPGQEGDVSVYSLAGAVQAGGVARLDGVGDPNVLVGHVFDTDDSVLCLAVSADGKKLAAGGCDRAVRVWDIAAGVRAAKLEQVVESHSDWVMDVAFSPDGTQLATAGRDKTAKVWDLAARESVVTFPEHQQPVMGVTLSADGKTGFSAGADKAVRSWKTNGEGKQLKHLGNHSDDIYRLAANPARTMLVTCSADKSVKLWDADKGGNSKTFTGLADHVYAVAIRADGKRVAAAGYDGEVRVWNADDGKQVAAFNASPGYKPAAAAK